MKLKLTLLAVALGVSALSQASVTCTGFYPDGDTVSIVASVTQRGKSATLALPQGPDVAYDLAEILGSEVERVECTADGAELAYIVGRFNLPTVNDHIRVRWYGDTARFILGNIALFQGN